MGAIEEYKTRNAARDARCAEKQEPPEKWRWWFRQPVPIDRFTGWLVAWTALLFAATVANVAVINLTDEKIGRQAEIASRQLDVMQSQTRPWMKSEFKVGSISKDENGQLNLQFAQRMINIGNHPAALAFVGAVFIPDPGAKLPAVQKEYCDTLGMSSWKNNLKWPFGVAFPNEWTNWESGSAIVTAKVIVDWQKSIIEEKNINEGDLKPIWLSHIKLVYVGCITYAAQRTADAIVHQTGFVFYLPGTFDISDSGPVNYNYPATTLTMGFYSNYEKQDYEAHETMK